MSSISLIVDDCLWFHSVIQTGDLSPSLQIIQISMSSLLARKNRVRLLLMYFFYSILKSVLLGGFSLGDRQLYLLHAFTPTCTPISSLRSWRYCVGARLKFWRRRQLCRLAKKWLWFETDNLVQVSWLQVLDVAPN